MQAITPPATAIFHSELSLGTFYIYKKHHKATSAPAAKMKNNER
jgi:hypothetical protein